MTKLLPLLVVVVFGFGIMGCELDSDDSDAGTDAGTDSGTDSGTDAGTDSGTDGGTDSGVDGGDDGGLPSACQPDTTCNVEDSSTCHDACSSVCGDSSYVAVYECIEGTRCYCLCTMGECTHDPT